MPLATKNNAIIVKDGRLAENCNCCGWVCVSCGGTYSYGPTAPHYKGSIDCPVVACDGTASCDGLVLDGHLEGPVVSRACAINASPKARIVSAVLDNSGSIGSASATYPPPPPSQPCPVDVARIANQTTDAELLDIGDDQYRMRVPFSVTNGPGGGPYGVLEATICFYFERNPP
jgi:hypothetical protein